VGALVRDFKGRSRAQKAYISTKIAGPVGVVLVFVGATADDHALLIAGIVLLGLFFLDALVVFPILRARHDLKRRRAPDSN
jgi:hypothetical protein